MKRIIDERMYNTETADCVAKYNDPEKEELGIDIINGELYLKKTGEWFLCGNSEICRLLANNYGNISRVGETVIIPFYEDEAKVWLANHNFVDEYIKYFGEPEE